MKRIDFLKLVGLAPLVPKLLVPSSGAGTGKAVVNKTKEEAIISSRRGITDVIRELNLYTPTNTFKTEEVECVNGIDIVNSNSLQIFRSVHCEEGMEIDEASAQKRFEDMKRDIDLAMLHSRKSSTYYSDGELIKGFAIQTMGGLDCFITSAGTIIEAQEYGKNLFNQIVQVLVGCRCPTKYLMATHRKEYDRVLKSFAGSSNCITRNGNYSNIKYKGFSFDLTPLDNIASRSSYLIPLSMAKLKNGSLKNRFSGKYSEMPTKLKKVNDVWSQWDYVYKNTKRREWYSCQCVEVIGSEYFIKINHH